MHTRHEKVMTLAIASPGRRLKRPAVTLVMTGTLVVAAAAGLMGTLGFTRAGSPAERAPWYGLGTDMHAPMARKAFAGAGAAFAGVGAAVAGAAAHSSVQAQSGQAALTGAQGPLIEQTGSMTVVVPAKLIGTDVNDLTSMAAGSGGFVASTSTQSVAPGQPAQAVVTLQVPEARFGGVLNQVRALGNVASEQTSATDVTGQYVDLQARITALQDSREQYLTIMAKATTIGAVLAVQAQLDNLQSQLEQLQSQQKTLTQETTYSTLVVTLTEKVATPPPPRPEGGLQKAWNGAVSGFVAGFEGLVRLAGPVFFALLLAAALLMAARASWRIARPRFPLARRETSEPVQ